MTDTRAQQTGSSADARRHRRCADGRRARDVTIDELCTFLDGRGLMKQKWPERLVVVDDFPPTGLGKVAKSELAQLIAGGNP